ncbi:MAG: hypothetical protein H8E81_10610 [Deltaproteobacteria bacterium]|nr:hypothetical protein [Deltaproteobacteria bacterium]
MNHKIGVNGVELAYTNTGRGEPIFLLHGWPATGRPFSRSSLRAFRTPAYFSNAYFSFLESGKL